ncbi:MAG: GAF domain-containing protein [bacterium]
MTPEKKERLYRRILDQLGQLLTKTKDPDARMATIIALLHHKFSYYFWTGFYFLRNGELTVKNYQGALSCQVLEKNKGVCWAGINQGKTIVVPDVHKFPGHIACDSRSNSEIVVPVKDQNGKILGVLDVDSKELNSFDEVDARYLEEMVKLIYP